MEARTPSTHYGSLHETDDNQIYVRFERHYPHPIDKVWAAITEPRHLQRWFPGFTIELKEGGVFQIFFGGDCEGPAHVEGIVTVFDPPNTLALGTMRFELERSDAGCTLVFTDVLQFDGVRTDDQFANSVLGGWHAFMDRLDAELAGLEPGEHPEPDYSKIETVGRHLVST